MSINHPGWRILSRSYDAPHLPHTKHSRIAIIFLIITTIILIIQQTLSQPEVDLIPDHIPQDIRNFNSLDKISPKDPSLALHLQTSGLHPLYVHAQSIPLVSNVTITPNPKNYTIPFSLNNENTTSNIGILRELYRDISLNHKEIPTNTDLISGNACFVSFYINYSKLLPHYHPYELKETMIPISIFYNIKLLGSFHTIEVSSRILLLPPYGSLQDSMCIDLSKILMSSEYSEIPPYDTENDSDKHSIWCTISIPGLPSLDAEIQIVVRLGFDFTLTQVNTTPWYTLRIPRFLNSTDDTKTNTNNFNENQTNSEKVDNNLQLTENGDKLTSIDPKSPYYNLYQYQSPTPELCYNNSGVLYLNTKLPYCSCDLHHTGVDCQDTGLSILLSFDPESVVPSYLRSLKINKLYPNTSRNRFLTLQKSSQLSQSDSFLSLSLPERQLFLQSVLSLFRLSYSLTAFHIGLYPAIRGEEVPMSIIYFPISYLGTLHRRSYVIHVPMAPKVTTKSPIYDPSVPVSWSANPSSLSVAQTLQFSRFTNTFLTNLISNGVFSNYDSIETSSRPMISGRNDTIPLLGSLSTKLPPTVMSTKLDMFQLPSDIVVSPSIGQFYLISPYNEVEIEFKGVPGRVYDVLLHLEILFTARHPDRDSDDNFEMSADKMRNTCYLEHHDSIIFQNSKGDQSQSNFLSKLHSPALTIPHSEIHRSFSMNLHLKTAKCDHNFITTAKFKFPRVGAGHKRFNITAHSFLVRDSYDYQKYELSTQFFQVSARCVLTQELCGSYGTIDPELCECHCDAGYSGIYCDSIIARTVFFKLYLVDPYSLQRMYGGDEVLRTHAYLHQVISLLSLYTDSSTFFIKYLNTVVLAAPLGSASRQQVLIQVSLFSNHTLLDHVPIEILRGEIHIFDQYYENIEELENHDSTQSITPRANSSFNPPEDFPDTAIINCDTKNISTPLSVLIRPPSPHSLADLKSLHPNSIIQALHHILTHSLLRSRYAASIQPSSVSGDPFQLIFQLMSCIITLERFNFFFDCKVDGNSVECVNQAPFSACGYGGNINFNKTRSVHCVNEFYENFPEHHCHGLPLPPDPLAGCNFQWVCLSTIKYLYKMVNNSRYYCENGENLAENPLNGVFEFYGDINDSVLQSLNSCDYSDISPLLVSRECDTCPCSISPSEQHCVITQVFTHMTNPSKTTTQFTIVDPKFCGTSPSPMIPSPKYDFKCNERVKILENHILPNENDNFLTVQLSYRPNRHRGGSYGDGDPYRRRVLFTMIPLQRFERLHQIAQQIQNLPNSQKKNIQNQSTLINDRLSAANSDFTSYFLPETMIHPIPLNSSFYNNNFSLFSKDLYGFQIIMEPTNCSGNMWCPETSWDTGETEIPQKSSSTNRNTTQLSQNTVNIEETMNVTLKSPISIPPGQYVLSAVSYYLASHDVMELDLKHQKTQKFEHGPDKAQFAFEDEYRMVFTGTSLPIPITMTPKCGPNNCFHGTCDHLDTCQCFAAYYGSQCQYSQYHSLKPLSKCNNGFQVIPAPSIPQTSSHMNKKSLSQSEAHHNKLKNRQFGYSRHNMDDTKLENQENTQLSQNDQSLQFSILSDSSSHPTSSSIVDQTTDSQKIICLCLGNYYTANPTITHRNPSAKETCNVCGLKCPPYQTPDPTCTQCLCSDDVCQKLSYYATINVNRLFIGESSSNDHVPFTYDVYNIISQAITAQFKLVTHLPSAAAVSLVPMFSLGKRYLYTVDEASADTTHQMHRIHDEFYLHDPPLYRHYYKLVVSFPPGFRPPHNDDYLPDDFGYDWDKHSDDTTPYHFITLDSTALEKYFFSKIYHSIFERPLRNLAQFHKKLGGYYSIIYEPVPYNSTSSPHINEIDEIDEIFHHSNTFPASDLSKTVSSVMIEDSRYPILFSGFFTYPNQFNSSSGRLSDAVLAECWDYTLHKFSPCSITVQSSIFRDIFSTCPLIPTQSKSRKSTTLTRCRDQTNFTFKPEFCNALVLGYPVVNSTICDPLSQQHTYDQWFLFESTVFVAGPNPPIINSFDSVSTYIIIGEYVQFTWNIPQNSDLLPGQLVLIEFDSPFSDHSTYNIKPGDKYNIPSAAVPLGMFPAIAMKALVHIPVILTPTMGYFTITLFSPGNLHVMTMVRSRRERYILHSTPSTCNIGSCYENQFCDAVTSRCLCKSQLFRVYYTGRGNSAILNTFVDVYDNRKAFCIPVCLQYCSRVGGQCDPETHECICHPLYFGPMCSQKAAGRCRNGYILDKEQPKCMCSNHWAANATTGMCDVCTLKELCNPYGTNPITFSDGNCKKCICQSNFGGRYCQYESIFALLKFSPRTAENLPTQASKLKFNSLKERYVIQLTPSTVKRQEMYRNWRKSVKFDAISRYQRMARTLNNEYNHIPMTTMNKVDKNQGYKSTLQPMNGQSHLDDSSNDPISFINNEDDDDLAFSKNTVPFTTSHSFSSTQSSSTPNTITPLDIMSSSYLTAVFLHTLSLSTYIPYSLLKIHNVTETTVLLEIQQYDNNDFLSHETISRRFDEFRMNFQRSIFASSQLFSLLMGVETLDDSADSRIPDDARPGFQRPDFFLPSEHERSFFSTLQVHDNDKKESDNTSKSNGELVIYGLSPASCSDIQQHTSEPKSADNFKSKFKPSPLRQHCMKYPLGELQELESILIFPKKVPFYQKVWFILMMLLIVIAICSCIGLSLYTCYKYEWCCFISQEERLQRDKIKEEKELKKQLEYEEKQRQKELESNCDPTKIKKDNAMYVSRDFIFLSPQQDANDIQAQHFRSGYGGGSGGEVEMVSLSSSEKYHPHSHKTAQKLHNHTPLANFTTPSQLTQIYSPNGRNDHIITFNGKTSRYKPHYHHHLYQENDPQQHLSPLSEQHGLDDPKKIQNKIPSPRDIALIMSNNNNRQDNQTVTPSMYLTPQITRSTPHMQSHRTHSSSFQVSLLRGEQNNIVRNQHPIDRNNQNKNNNKYITSTKPIPEHDETLRDPDKAHHEKDPHKNRHNSNYHDVTQNHQIEGHDEKDDMYETDNPLKTCASHPSMSKTGKNEQVPELKENQNPHISPDYDASPLLPSSTFLLDLGVMSPHASPKPDISATRLINSLDTMHAVKTMSTSRSSLNASRSLREAGPGFEKQLPGQNYEVCQSSPLNITPQGSETVLTANFGGANNHRNIPITPQKQRLGLNNVPIITTTHMPSTLPAIKDNEIITPHALSDQNTQIQQPMTTITPIINHERNHGSFTIQQGDRSHSDGFILQNRNNQLQSHQNVKRTFYNVSDDDLEKITANDLLTPLPSNDLTPLSKSLINPHINNVPYNIGKITSTSSSSIPLKPSGAYIPLPQPFINRQRHYNPYLLQNVTFDQSGGNIHNNCAFLLDYQNSLSIKREHDEMEPTSHLQKKEDSKARSRKTVKDDTKIKQHDHIENSPDKSNAIRHDDSALHKSTIILNHHKSPNRERSKHHNVETQPTHHPKKNTKQHHRHSHRHHQRLLPHQADLGFSQDVLSLLSTHSSHSQQPNETIHTPILSHKSFSQQFHINTNAYDEGNDRQLTTRLGRNRSSHHFSSHFPNTHQVVLSHETSHLNNQNDMGVPQFSSEKSSKSIKLREKEKDLKMQPEEIPLDDDNLRQYIFDLPQHGHIGITMNSPQNEPVPKRTSPQQVTDQSAGSAIILGEKSLPHTPHARSQRSVSSQTQQKTTISTSYHQSHHLYGAPVTITPPHIPSRPKPSPLRGYIPHIESSSMSSKHSKFPGFSQPISVHNVNLALPIDASLSGSGLTSGDRSVSSEQQSQQQQPRSSNVPHHTQNRPVMILNKKSRKLNINTPDTSDISANSLQRDPQTIQPIDPGHTNNTTITTYIPSPTTNSAAPLSPYHNRNNPILDSPSPHSVPLNRHQHPLSPIPTQNEPLNTHYSPYSMLTPPQSHKLNLSQHGTPQISLHDDKDRPSHFELVPQTNKPSIEPFVPITTRYKPTATVLRGNQRYNYHQYNTVKHKPPHSHHPQQQQPITPRQKLLTPSQKQLYCDVHAKLPQARFTPLQDRSNGSSSSTKSSPGQNFNASTSPAQHLQITKASQQPQSPFQKVHLSPFKNPHLSYTPDYDNFNVNINDALNFNIVNSNNVPNNNDTHNNQKNYNQPKKQLPHSLKSPIESSPSPHYRSIDLPYDISTRTIPESDDSALLNAVNGGTGGTKHHNHDDMTIAANTIEKMNKYSPYKHNMNLIISPHHHINNGNNNYHHLDNDHLNTYSQLFPTNIPPHLRHLNIAAIDPALLPSIDNNLHHHSVTPQSTTMSSYENLQEPSITLTTTSTQSHQNIDIDHNKPHHIHTQNHFLPTMAIEPMNLTHNGDDHAAQDEDNSENSHAIQYIPSNIDYNFTDTAPALIRTRSHQQGTTVHQKQKKTKKHLKGDDLG